MDKTSNSWLPCNAVGAIEVSRYLEEKVHMSRPSSREGQRHTESDANVGRTVSRTPVRPVIELAYQNLTRKLALESYTRRCENIICGEV